MSNDPKPATEPPQTRAATGATPLADVLAMAAQEGFELEFGVADGDAPDDRLRCPNCETDSAAADFDREWSHRLEGASDPADMLHVSALRCPRCGSPGVFVSAFGPAASAREAAVLTGFPDPRRSGPIEPG
jgi:ribosomal protein S27AE